MILILVVTLSLCIGSFLNVCIYRLPRELSIVKPFSFCPQCKKSIRWYDNIPLLSYILLKGKCRDCGKSIPFRYFLVELVTALVILFTYLQFGLTLIFFKYVVLFCICIAVTFIDIDFRAIPGWICILGILLGLVFSLAESFIIFRKVSFVDLSLSQLPVARSMLGALLCIGLSYFFKIMGDLWLWMYLTLRGKDSIEGEKEALGLGDVDFLGMTGAFLGWQLGFLTFFLAPIISLIYGIYIIVFKKSHLIAYLPFLSMAVIISSFWGVKIINYFFPF